MVRWPFATKLETVDTVQVINPNLCAPYFYPDPCLIPNILEIVDVEKPVWRAMAAKGIPCFLKNGKVSSVWQ